MVSVVCWQLSLHRADNSSRGVLPRVWCIWVWSQRFDNGRLWSTRGCRASGEKHYLQSWRDHFDSFCIDLCKKEINVMAVFLLVHPQVSRQSWSKLVFKTCCSCCRRFVIEALAIQYNEQTFTQMSENIAVKEVVWWLNYQRNLLFLNINTSRIL
jgi:hypothetical protein